MTAGAKKTHGLSTKRCVLVILSVVIAVLAVFAIISVMTPELWTGLHEERFKIADFQFSENFLKLTVKNIGDAGTGYQGVGVELVTVAEVMVERVGDLPGLNESVPNRVPMSIPIHMDEQALISVGYDWISGKTYRIVVTTSRGNNCCYTAVAP